MYRVQILNELRRFLAENSLQAMVILTNDPHFGEYTQPHYKVREWLSGFTGSAGTLVVTQREAALWTDSRYFIQAESQLRGSGIRLMRMGVEFTPSIACWIRREYPQGANIAIDGKLFSLEQYRDFQAELDPDCRVVLIEDPFDSLWCDRPKLYFNPIRELAQLSCGESTAEKYRRFKSLLKMEEGERFVYYLCSCDDIAWFCNIRGNDIEYNPLPLSYLLVTHSALHLFVDTEALDEQVLLHLKQEGVEIHSYSAIEQVMASLSDDMTRIFYSRGISVAHYNILHSSAAKEVEDGSVGGLVANMKAVKNNWELEGFRRAFLYDGVAWCKVLCQIEESLKGGVPLTEYGIQRLFLQFRSEREEYSGESFEPIVAYGKNGALPHYAPSRESDTPIEGDGFLLMDTGAHYSFGGTTDTTRTIAVGVLNDERKKFYTLVLKGMINLSRALFPAGTRGSSLDILAREFLYNEGVMYYHGTSHGIGHYLCVHEGPQSIRREENPVTLKPGMVLSNEPAIYFEGSYGIRIENVLTVKEAIDGKFGDFYGFETLTLVPISTAPIERELLTGSEIEWINSYNSNVYNKISPLLEEKERVWLREATRKF